MTENTKQLSVNPFHSLDSFELAQRMVKPLASSDLVPQQFRNNTANCLIAMNMANRMGADPFMVMQSIYVVNGKPSFSAKFLIALVNSSGMLKDNLAFEMVGKVGTNDYGCFCAGTSQQDRGLIGPTVTIEMAKAEGWYTRNGSKWQTLPEMMLRYRAASFWVSLFAPELTLGIRTTEEAFDIGDAQVIDNESLESLNETLEEKAKELAAPVLEPEPDMSGGWPQAHPEIGEDVWTDAVGETYNPDIHGWSAAENKPAVTKLGHFRKKRKYRDRKPEESTEKQEPETTTEESPEDIQYSPTLNSMLMAVRNAEDHAAIERVINHPFAKELADSELEILKNQSKERASELSD